MAITERDTPISDKERAQWMLHRLVPEHGICNVGFAVKVPARLRWWPLREALDHVVRRHPALRTSIQPVGHELRKRFLAADEATVPLEVHQGTAEEVTELVTGLIAERMDLDRPPLVRAHMIMLPDATVVCVVLHHLVVDDVTTRIVTRETAALYDAYADGDTSPQLPAPAPPQVEPAPDAAAIEFWTEHLAGIDPERLALAGARPVPDRPTFAAARLDRTLSEEAGEAVARLRSRTRTTDNIVLLAAYYLLLAGHGAGPDLAVGVPVTTRRGSARNDAAGFHANILPIRVRVDLGTDFATLVRTTRDAFLGGLEHGHASFESVRHALDTRSADWRAPLFRQSFNYRPAGPDELTMAGRPVEYVDAWHGLSRLDLELIVQAGPPFELTAVYSTEAHGHEDVADLLDRYENLLIALASDPDRPLREVDALPAADRALLARVNDTARPWPAGTVPDMISDRARRTPGAPAVDELTYGELAGLAAGVRDALLARGVAPGDVVGTYAGRGPGLAAAVLGVWAAGAAYLPLDPAHPIPRARHELDDAGVGVVLTDRDLPGDLAGGRHAVRLDTVPGGIPETRSAPGPEDAPAYLLYTSGSTGRPKGVLVTHGNLANVVRHFADMLKVTPGDRVMWLTTFAFDISALELLLALSTGARAVVADDRAQVDPGVLASLVERADVTLIQATPTTWRQLVPRLRGRLRGRRVLCGGEPLTAPLAERLLAEKCQVFNVYGPTETTIWSTAAELEPPVPERVPIGRPIANTTVRVVDEHGRAAPPGVPGELCIGGRGVALGYLGDEERTGRVFRTAGGLGRHYRTGDVVRLRRDGQLEFLGRVDRQVKIRGHRVELGEIESVLEQHPGVRAAAALAEPDAAGGLRIVAAVQGEISASDDQMERLRRHAAGLLPGAAVPARFAVVGDIPTNGSGKVDYRRLAESVAPPGDGPAPQPPADPTTRLVVELWRTLLDHPRITAESNFFLCGGHSLIAVELAERVNVRLGTDVDFTDVFAAPTPARFAALLSERRRPR
ncbi:amino acid adenylation domain-containing protein [Actinomadura madurae]|uniref:Amino acid adenylation domain-containing protein n=1 Tax=Actinomadura madurae TaxID=1993 RepID=A0A1I5IEC9_9ACTN|nr:non-ribosomal peptide synthetase [Actinomadura madurae]SFO58907.1 amino acid adenylation domain-containing protein [Actinomadura madurae]